MIASKSDIAVHCRGVTKHYGEGEALVRALRGIDLDVRVGELMMLVGPSGCGKTTLISVVAGILDHDDGECLVFGNNLKGMGQNQRTQYRGENIGFVFQAFNLFPTLTGVENVAVPLLLNGQPWDQAVRRGHDLLEQVGLGHRKNACPPQMSGGEQQRVAIARALIHNPRLIVCDEPTSSLDHDTGQKIMAILRQVALDANRALLIVTHDARIFDFADRIAKMDDGHIEKVVNSPAEL